MSFPFVAFLSKKKGMAGRPKLKMSLFEVNNIPNLEAEVDKAVSIQFMQCVYQNE
jgi:hypothetical protein